MMLCLSLEALKARNKARAYKHFALSALRSFDSSHPGPLAQAITFRAFGAPEQGRDVKFNASIDRSFHAFLGVRFQRFRTSVHLIPDQHVPGFLEQ